MKVGTPQDLPIRQRVARQDSKSTIVNCLDALVELITNSDDSYRRLEEQGHKKSGLIEIVVSRKKGGVCSELQVRDYAEGISSEKMQSVYPYGERSSGIEKFSVRGYFGRGLKQSILAFGEGEIHSVYNGAYSGVKIWWDNEKEKAQFVPIEELTINERKDLNIGLSPNETLIIIRNKFEDNDYSIPSYSKFKPLLVNHYTLRDILTSQQRKINLTVKDWKSTNAQDNLRFIFPGKFKKILEEPAVMEKSGDKLLITIFESESPFPFEKPTGLSGLILKSKGANLDMRLFSYENEDAAFYFFGTVDCEGLYEQIKNDAKNLVEPNRSGMNWRHPYCIEIQRICEKILAPHIDRKKRELSKESEAHLSRNKREILNKLRHLLNDIARDELEDLEQHFTSSSIETLQIFPNYAYIEPGQWRTFTILAPKYLIDDCGVTEVKISSNNYLVYPSDEKLDLLPHPKYKDEELFFNTFQISGDKLGEIAKITCKLKDYEAQATIAIREQGNKGESPEKKVNSGGFIKDIKADVTINPSQRAKFDEGVISVFINFPGSSKHFSEDLRGLTQADGQLLLAEVVAEAFFRSIVLRKVEKRAIVIIPGKEIDAYNRGIYELQRKYLSAIQEGIMEFVNS